MSRGDKRCGSRGSGSVRAVLGIRARCGSARVAAMARGAHAPRAAGDPRARGVELELLVLDFAHHILRLRAAQLAHVEPLLGLVEVLAAAHHAGERHVAADEATPGLEPRRARVRGELSHSRGRVRFSERGLFL